MEGNAHRVTIEKALYNPKFYHYALRAYSIKGNARRVPTERVPHNPKFSLICASTMEGNTIWPLRKRCRAIRGS